MLPFQLEVMKIALISFFLFTAKFATEVSSDFPSNFTFLMNDGCCKEKLVHAWLEPPVKLSKPATDIQFTCSVSTDRAVFIQWLFAGSELSAGPGTTITDATPWRDPKSESFLYQSTLTIFNATQEQAGVYVCRIYGATSKPVSLSATLAVSSKPPSAALTINIIIITAILVPFFLGTILLIFFPVSPASFRIAH